MMESSSPQASPSGSAAYYCSQGIVQYCTPADNVLYMEPPPPLFSDDDDASSGSSLSPLVIGLVSVLAAAVLLLCYYTFAYKYCKRRRRSGSRWSEERLQTRLRQLVLEDTGNGAAASLQFTANSNGGLEEQFIRSITVFKYRRGEGLVESTDCAVCLTDFKEEESLRLMTNCQHAFHPPCIDTWLRSHSNCPICRASIVGAPPPPPPPIVSRMRVDTGGDIVVVVDSGGQDRVRELDLRRPESGSPAEGEKESGMGHVMST